MRSVISHRDAIDAFERNHPELSAEDKQFFERLRGDDYAAKLDEAWSQIRKTRRWTVADDARIIECLVKALRVAEALPKVPAETAKSRSEIDAAKKAAIVLRNYYARHLSVEAANLRRGLAWAEKNIDSEELLCDLNLAGDAGMVVALNLEGSLRISRKLQTRAAQRRTFMLQVGQAMRDFFGRPCDRAVAALTSVAFKVDTDIDDVRNAWKWYVQRKV
jgi:hypothetical protein